MVHDLRHDDAGYGMVTGVCERDGLLCMGSIAESALLVMHTPA
jgi:hypothetical protein